MDRYRSREQTGLREDKPGNPLTCTKIEQGPRTQKVLGVQLQGHQVGEPFVEMKSAARISTSYDCRDSNKTRQPHPAVGPNNQTIVLFTDRTYSVILILGFCTLLILSYRKPASLQRSLSKDYNYEYIRSTVLSLVASLVANRARDCRLPKHSSGAPAAGSRVIDEFMEGLDLGERSAFTYCWWKKIKRTIERRLK
ncbi:hypothetical protein RRG08_043673 [Elysia crispata]|uniref:Uncharacterized protein n=1 Tax=Elysia crispata TaxID=231223 RepID=A0AAE0ZUN1_9GAST|nr:hypothetical protein RRG08_043673 [Elysia crispata]